MSISKQFKILSVKAEPHLYDKENVVTYVFWAVHFEIDGYSNEAVIETHLDFDPNSAFTPAQEITKEQILSWVIAKVGGDQFLTRLEENHVSHLETERARQSLVNLPLSFVESVALPTDETAIGNNIAAKIASDREYIRVMVLEILEEQMLSKTHASE